MSSLKKLKITTKEDLLVLLNTKTIPHNPFEIAKEIGINVVSDINWDRLGYDGEIYLNDNSEPEIWINPTNNINRQNFTLSHELGHLFNDVIPNIDKFKDPIYDDYTTLKRNGDQNIKEFKANRFASELLMPLDDINTIGEEFIISYQKEFNVVKVPTDKFINKMAIKFNVSESAMKYRLVNLGIIKR